MPEKSEKSRSLIPLYIMIVIFYIVVMFEAGEDKVLLEAISHESDYKVNLNEGVNYKLWIDSPEGPDKVDVTISRGSYIAFQKTFVLTGPKKSYLPSNPEFTVKENGTYNVHAKPLDPGTVYMEIEKLGISELQNQNDWGGHNNNFRILICRQFLFLNLLSNFYAINIISNLRVLNLRVHNLRVLNLRVHNLRVHNLRVPI